MRKRTWAALGVLGTVVVALGGLGAWIAALPENIAVAAEPVPPAEEAALLEALRPTRDRRPVIAIIGVNDATETTDYVVPAGLLRRADVADVTMLATAPGPVQLFPALKVEPDATIAEFDSAHPEGADYVIVPAMSRDDDPVALGWLQDQAKKGATIIGICAGAKVVGAAGLLDGKRATTHWWYLKDLLKRHPTIEYVPNRRMVVDGKVATTTGISASIPTMLTLIDAIGGRERALSVARDLGVEHWDTRHASAAFRLSRPFATTVLGNVVSVWNRETFGIALAPGMDEVSLALVADAWSRTYRSKAVTLADAMAAVVSANGIRILPDQGAADWPAARRVPSYADEPPAVALNHVLSAIGQRYGEPTTSVVAMQLEYPRQDAAR